MAFPTTPLDIETSLAFSADLSMDPSGLVYTDVTQYTRERPIVIDRGRADEKTQAEPSTCLLTFDNTNGRFTPKNPTGPYYGTFGRNTPVRVRIRHIRDTFTRTVSGGWGSADTGHSWATGFGAGGTVLTTDFNVASGVGTHSQPVANGYRARALSAVSLKNVDVAVTLTLPFTNVTGGSVEPGNILLRMQDTTTYYMARVEITTAEAVVAKLYNPTSTLLASATVSGLTHSSSQALRVRAQLVGPNFRMKVWAASGTEPAGWHVEATDSTLSSPGWIGLRSGVASGNTNTLPIVFSYDDFEVHVPRFTGYVSEWPPRWDASGNDQWVSIVASGKLRSLLQGNSPAQSALRRAILAAATATLLAYWPCEDGSSSTTVVSGLSGGSPLLTNGSVEFASDESVVGSKPLPNFTSSGLLLGGTIGAPALTSIQAGLVAAFINTTSSNVDVTSALEFRTEGFTWSIISYRVSGVGWVELICNPDSGGFTSAAIEAELFDGVPRWFSAVLTQDGGNIDFELFINGVSTVSNTISGTLSVPIGFPKVNSTRFDTDGTTDNLLTAGHIALWANEPTVINYSNAMGGHNGENSGTRFGRLCVENSITSDVLVGAIEAMGPQRTGKLPELLRECEGADEGLMVERTTGEIGFDPHAIRENVPVSLALNYASGHLSPPLDPTDDDLLLRNDVTITRTGGSSARVIDEDGPLGTNAIGTYDEEETLNLYDDDQPLQHAGYRVAHGTVYEVRFPRMRIDLNRNSTLIESWLSCDVGSRLTVINPPEDVPPDTIDQVIEGYTETLDFYTWDVEPNCSPYKPYHVFEFAETTGDTSEFLGWFIPSSCYSINAHDADDTSWLVFTDPNWSTLADDFPASVVVGGERLSLTDADNIANDTFTRSVTDGFGTATSGQSYTVTGTAGDFDVNGSAGTIQPTATGSDRTAVIDIGSPDVNMTGTFRLNTLPASGTMQFGFVGRRADGSNMYYCDASIPPTGAITLQLRKRVADTPSTLVTMALNRLNAATDYTMRFQIVGNRLRGRIWLSSLPEPTYWLEITDSSLTTGDTAGLFARNNTAVTTHIVTVDNLQVIEPKTWTVTRSVNGVSKSHATGAEIEIADPGIFGL